jgi:glycerol-3-phosphate cytidylyltransferase
MVHNKVKSKIVGITYGTFDTFHFGHYSLLKRAKELCDFLIVAVSTDEFNAIKGKKSYHGFEARKEIIENLKFVDLVIPEENWEQKQNDIAMYDVNIFIIGDDWEGKFNNLSCEVTYLPRTEGISSTIIKEHLK